MTVCLYDWLYDWHDMYDVRNVIGTAPNLSITLFWLRLLLEYAMCLVGDNLRDKDEDKDNFKRTGMFPYFAKDRE